MELCSSALHVRIDHKFNLSSERAFSRACRQDTVSPDIYTSTTLAECPLSQNYTSKTRASYNFCTIHLLYRRRLWRVFWRVSSLVLEKQRRVRLDGGERLRADDGVWTMYWEVHGQNDWRWIEKRYMIAIVYRTTISCKCVFYVRNLKPQWRWMELTSEQEWGVGSGKIYEWLAKEYWSIVKRKSIVIVCTTTAKVLRRRMCLSSVRMPLCEWVWM